MGFTLTDQITPSEQDILAWAKRDRGGCKCPSCQMRKAAADLIERQEAELATLRSELHDALHEAENVNLKAELAEAQAEIDRLEQIIIDANVARARGPAITETKE